MAHDPQADERDVIGPEWFWLLVGPGGPAPAFVGLGEWVALAAIALVPLLAVREPSSIARRAP